MCQFAMTFFTYHSNNTDNQYVVKPSDCEPNSFVHFDKDIAAGAAFYRW